MANDELRTKVADWLEKSGYPLEMFVADQFRQAGFTVLQGSYYEDSDAPRESDVIATKQINLAKTDGNLAMRVHFVAECKTSREKPWVVFLGDPGSWRPVNTLHRGPGNVRGRAGRMLFTKEDAARFPSVFQVSPAYGVVQTLRDSKGSDPSYTALMQACKAAVWVSRQQSSGLLTRMYNDAVQMAFPIVVIDGSLFSARLANGLVDVSEVAMHHVLFDHPDIGVRTTVAVVTKQALPDYVKQLTQTVEMMREWLKASASTLSGLFETPE